MRLSEVADALVLTMKHALRPMTERQDQLEGSVVLLSRELADLKARALVPGPPGKDGAPGADGKDGQDGAPGPAGAPGLQYLGVYQDQKSYDRGDIVTHGGSAWHCNTAGTADKPGDASTAWTLMVKHGRDAKGVR